RRTSPNPSLGLCPGSGEISTVSGQGASWFAGFGSAGFAAVGVLATLAVLALWLLAPRSATAALVGWNCGDVAKGVAWAAEGPRASRLGPLENPTEWVSPQDVQRVAVVEPPIGKDRERLNFPKQLIGEPVLVGRHENLDIELIAHLDRGLVRTSAIT